jgi:RimJ/RimL family protein N-acetyltransferase
MPILQPIPELETARLHIRPFTPADLETAHAVLDLDLHWAGRLSREQRQVLLQFHRDITCRLFGGIYGDRAIVLKDSQALIGLCGFRPWLCTQAERALFDPVRLAQEAPGHRLELGVGCGIAQGQRQQGYAREALQAIIAYAFEVWQVGRVVGLTGRGNVVSIRLMRSVGMQVAVHPDPAVEFPGAVGLIEQAAGRTG